MTTLQTRTIAALLATALATGTMLSPFGPVPAHAASPATTQADALTTATDTAIERMILIIDWASKHPAGRAGGLILRGYAAYKQWKNGRDITVMKGEVAVLRQTVHDMLSDIAGLIERIEQGEELSDAQWAASEQALDNHAARLAGLESRMDRVEAGLRETRRRLDETNAAVQDTARKVDVVRHIADTTGRKVERDVADRKAWIERNQVCREAAHVMRNGSCVHISVAEPRR